MTDGPNSLSLEYVEQLYEQYLADPLRVAPAWRDYFEREVGGNGHAAAPLAPTFRPASIFNPPAPADGAQAGMVSARFQERVDRLVWNYRLLGHLAAELDPLGSSRPQPPELAAEFYGFTASDLDRPLAVSPWSGPPVATLGELLAPCGPRIAGSSAPSSCTFATRQCATGLWSGSRPSENQIALERRQKVRILNRLIDAVIFDEFVQRKYIGAKIFSLEGAWRSSSRCWRWRSSGLPSRGAADRDGHGPPRPAERSGQHPRQEPAADLLRVRGRALRAAAAAGT